MNSNNVQGYEPDWSRCMGYEPIRSEHVLGSATSHTNNSFSIFMRNWHMAMLRHQVYTM